MNSGNMPCAPTLRRFNNSYNKDTDRIPLKIDTTQDVEFIYKDSEFTIQFEIITKDQIKELRSGVIGRYTELIISNELVSPRCRMSCMHCTRCTHCARCTHCTHCTRCTRCTSCTHCTHCTRCAHYAHCAHCAHCTPRCSVQSQRRLRERLRHRRR